MGRFLAFMDKLKFTIELTPKELWVLGHCVKASRIRRRKFLGYAGFSSRIREEVLKFLDKKIDKEEMNKLSSEWTNLAEVPPTPKPKQTPTTPKTTSYTPLKTDKGVWRNF